MESSGNTDSTSTSGKVEAYSPEASPYWPTVSAAPEETFPEFSSGRLGGISEAVAALFIVAEIVGAGILNQPYAMAQTGWSGIGLLIILAILATFAGTRLSQCWLILEELWPEYRSVNRSPYQAIAYRAYGKYGRGVIEFCIQVNLLGSSVVYLVLIGDFVSLLWNEIGHGMPEITPCEGILIFGILLMPLTWMESPKDFWWSSLIAVATTVATVIVVIVEVILENPYKNATFTPPTLRSFSFGFGSILFSMGGASMFPCVQNDMKNRERFSLSIISAFVFLDVMYLAVSSSSYAVLGDDAPANILDAITGPPVTAIRVLLLAHFLFAFVINMNPSMQSFEELFGLANRFTVYRALLRSAITSGVILVALLIPNFSKLLSLLGGTTVSIASFIGPPVLYWRLAGFIDPITEESVRKISAVQKAALLSMAVVGTVGGAAATYSAGLSIAEDSSFNSTCFSASSFLP